MARIRTIKPEFWVDEKVVELSAWARLLFIGLWNFADDDGRMEYREKKIRMQIFPADDLNISELFGELRREKLVHVYVIDGKEYLQICGFASHQKIDKRSASKLPPPPNPAESPRVPPTEGKGREGKGMDSTNPDGLVVASQADDEPTEPVNIDQQRPPDCQHQKIIALYHEILPTNPQIREWTDARAEQLRVRWHEDARRQDLDWWRKFFERIRDGCPFLTGQKAGGNGRPFRPGLEWIVKRENFVKILEGRYVEDAA